MGKVWEYNGVSLEFDAEDIETLERYEAAIAEMQERFAEMPDEAGTVAAMRRLCEAIRFLFDRIFGDGTAAKLLGERLHIGAAEEAYDSFLTFVHAQSVERTEKRARQLAKYMPNREQKRAEKRSKK